MASGREKRENAGEKLKDIIESLRAPKAAKNDIEIENDSESDGEFHDSFDQAASDNVANNTDQETIKMPDEIQELERELMCLQMERKKVELRRQIETEKDTLQKLQLPPKLTSAPEKTNKGEKISDITACSTEKTTKALQIVDFVWPEPIPQYQTITLSGDMEFRVGKKENSWQNYAWRMGFRERANNAGIG